MILKQERIFNEHGKYFQELWDLYQSSFPANEKRSLEAHRQLFKHPAYRLEVFYNTSFVAFISAWLYPKFSYLEHFAVSEAVRSGGFGTKVLQLWIAQQSAPIILEIEPVQDEISQRRLNFYQRLGFVANDFAHQQPAYSASQEPVDLTILSQLKPLELEVYADFYSKLTHEIIK